MPKAVVSLNSERRELKTAPPDGFVVVRKLTYGELLKRRNLSSAMRQDEDDPKEGILTMNFSSVAMYEFRTMIQDHNLEDENGKKLNFQDPQDVNRLDPKVAQEIEDIFNDLNNLETTGKSKDDLSPLPSSSGDSSQPKAVRSV